MKLAESLLLGLFLGVIVTTSSMFLHGNDLLNLGGALKKGFSETKIAYKNIDLCLK